MKLEALSDQELLNTYLSGNEKAISVLIERHRKRVSDYIYMMVKDRDISDDIFQETFIKVIKFLEEGRYVENGRFVSWVLRIAHWRPRSSNRWAFPSVVTMRFEPSAIRRSWILRQTEKSVR